MKKIILLSVLMAAFLVFAANAATITSVASGNWSDAATWDNGVPGAGDDVIIDTSNSVTINTGNAECNNLTVIGKLYFDGNTSDNALTVHGNVTVEGRFRTAETAPTGPQVQYITLYGDLTVNEGGVFDMRYGSSKNVSVGKVLFTGNTNSTINLSLTNYSSSTEEFNSVEIKKTEGAKVILGSGNLFMNNNTSNSADTLILTSGIIETGSNFWITLRTSSGAIMGASDSSYVVGQLGHGITNGGGDITDEFPVGDSATFRPIKISFIGPANSTGHYVWVSLHNENADPGTSKFSGDIDKVSALRYYEVGYNSGSSGAAAMGIYRFSPTYKEDDGVAAGNTDLRVAYSTDTLVTWVDAGPTDYTTALPDTIVSDSLATISLASGNSMFVSLARKAGTTTNNLGTLSAVKAINNSSPSSYNLSQNYPNPFNPSTEINFSIAKSGFVKLVVYNVLGKVVSTLADGEMASGSYHVNFNALNLSSGVYFYTITVNGFSQTRKMMLLK